MNLLRLQAFGFNVLRQRVDDVENAFGRLGEVLDLELDEFDRIMCIIKSHINMWRTRIRGIDRLLETRIKDGLREVKHLFDDCEGSDNITLSRTLAMDLLQEILLIVDANEGHISLARKLKVGIARPKDMEEIARLLLEDSYSYNSRYPVSVFPIVGMPGSGKTSLAYLLFHHQSIKDHFGQRVWLHWEDISRVRSANKSILEIIEQTFYFTPNQKKEINFDAKYLLVIEDFPNEDNGEKWFDLLKPLLSAFAKSKPGSKILVTSCSTSLQPQVLLDLEFPLAKGAPYLLGPLDHADSLDFFQSIAFRKLPDDLRPHLMDIALEIFNKCTYNLRVIKIVASILSSQPPSKWQHFNEVVLNIQNPVKHVLSILDIMQQPRLFDYHSLFPLDHEFNKVEIYQLWDAQQQYTDEKSKEMFETLLGNENLFKSCKRDKFGVVVYYKLQVLAHGVAKYLARNKYNLVDNSVKEVNLRIDHVGITADACRNPRMWHNRSEHLKSLLLLPSNSCRTAVSLNLIFNMHLKGIQALDIAISDCRHFQTSIGLLKDLRYLRLGISSETLPECITNLKLLQTLDLRHSRVRELPEGFPKLRHLKHLYIGDRLKDLPPRFGELTKLQTLDVFIVGNNNGLDALASFTHLAGKLRIRYQEDREEQVLPENTTFLKDKKLHELSLEWSSSNAAPAVAEKYKKENDMELELLQPPSALKVLTVKGWKGETFPQLEIDHFSSVLNNLVSIHIADCSRCKHLPSFSKLGCLKFLDLWGLIALEWIENCDNISMVSSEAPYFSSLEHLSLVNLPRLKGWTRVEEHNTDYEQEKQRNLNCLYDLRLSGCPELISMPDMPILHSLEISNCHRDLLQHFLNVQASAAVSSSSSSSASPAVPVLQNLCSLTVSNMSIEEPLLIGLKCLTTLEELSLSWLYNLRILPESIGHLILLRQLVIRYLPNLLDLPESLAGLSALEHVEIQYCPRLKQVPGYFSELKSNKRLHIKECVNLEKMFAT